MACIVMNHWYSDEWCTDGRARSQEQLQEIAAQIRKHCKVEQIAPVLGQSDTANICTIYVNEGLGIKYWVKDTFGHISEIDEARSY